MIPTLQTARLTLVPICDDHIPFEIALDGDAEVMRYVTGKPRDREEVLLWHAKRLSLLSETADRGHWVGFDGDEPIGLWMLMPRKNGDDPDIGWRVARQHWRRGYATEGARAVLEFAFGVGGVERVFADAMVVNPASIKTMEKLGMTFQRTFMYEYEEMIEGSEKGDVEYAISRQEWEALAEKKLEV